MLRIKIKQKHLVGQNSDPHLGKACDGMKEKENTMNNIRIDDSDIEKGDRGIVNHSSLPESNVIVIESDNIQEAHVKDEKSRAQK